MGDGVNRAVMKVPGVKANTAVKDAATFQVAGDFDAKQLFAALQERLSPAKSSRRRN